MGGSNSKDGHVINGGNPGTSKTLPEEPPYPGPSPEYRFINTEIANTGRYTLGGAGAGKEIISSNIDSVYPMFAGHYNENFRLMSFYKTPMIRREGMFSSTILIPYQAIFYRYPHPNEGWRLEIEKSAIEGKVDYNHSFINPQGISTDSSHLIQSIARHSEQGGRLICMEETGQHIAKGFSAGLSGHIPTVGVDIFFDMPTHPNPEIYTYQMTTIPITARGKFGGEIAADCDWATHLGQFLSQGWRLVEIFLDNSLVVGKAFSGTVYMNAVWIFEKPMSRVNDPTPVYQGTFIEHFVTIKGGLGGKISGNFDWDQKINEMANNGWELACILKTPEQRICGFAKAKLKFIIFFQRKILSEEASGATGGYDKPPSYDSLKG
ncbi:hypothetical protein LOTGIDRAFT_234531 [Lottia gigantea]|uniref:Uncharacterized protein n=1 Tax=Lottia gigantea TaxID=225164 RepID=V3ZVU0_LOTGI|nr:hypothetical protein LOTGIDRAFT_234531 [Lottia gigantea]ESO88477.1 hypothetical protein LOTGIDRAFT_234531 [Lottia gigantea]